MNKTSLYATSSDSKKKIEFQFAHADTLGFIGGERSVGDTAEGRTGKNINKVKFQKKAKT